MIRENVALAPMTTLEVGGPARYLVEAEAEDQLVEALQFAAGRSLPVFVLGGGSNILVSDEGFDGVVIRVNLRGIHGLDAKEPSHVTAAAGESWDAFVAACVRRGLGGIECLSGIPGTVGGTPVQNVGAYGQEVSGTITSVRVLDRESLEFLQRDNAACAFGYRSSIFNTVCRGRYVVAAVTFALRANALPQIRYADLQRRFQGRTEPIFLAEVREAVLQVRASKGMVLTPGDPDCRSAGSFFRNPVVDRDRYLQIAEAARSRGLIGPQDSIPGYAQQDGAVKVPAAWLIEQAGFLKGHSRGRAGISTRHTLALVNRGGARAHDILNLACVIQDGVRAVFSVNLVSEPEFVGFEPGSPGAALANKLAPEAV